MTFTLTDLVFYVSAALVLGGALGATLAVRATTTFLFGKTP